MIKFWLLVLIRYKEDVDPADVIDLPDPADLTERDDVSAGVTWGRRDVTGGGVGRAAGGAGAAAPNWASGRCIL